jgi:hypothetical protein
MSKTEFVINLGKLLRMALPHLIDCQYQNTEYGEYVYVICENGHQYKVDVTANSLSAIAYDVFKEMRLK